MLTVVVPMIEWRGFLDQIAVISYLLGIIPLSGIALMELGVLWKNASPDERSKIHFELLIGFLIISHVAMVFGMVDPTLSGWQPAPVEMHMNHSMSH